MINDDDTCETREFAERSCREWNWCRARPKPPWLSLSLSLSSSWSSWRSSWWNNEHNSHPDHHDHHHYHWHLSASRLGSTLMPFIRMSPRRRLPNPRCLKMINMINPWLTLISPLHDDLIALHDFDDDLILLTWFWWCQWRQHFQLTYLQGSGKVRCPLCLRK